MPLSSTLSSDTSWGGTRLGAHISSELYDGVRFGAQGSATTYPPTGTTAVKRFSRAASNYSSPVFPVDLTNTVARYRWVDMMGFNGAAVNSTLTNQGLFSAVYKDAMMIANSATLGSSLNANYAVAYSEGPTSWRLNLGWNGATMGDIGNSAFQTKWADNAIACAVAGGFNAIFIDDIRYKLGSYPSAYPNQAAWQAAFDSFLALVGPRIKAAGLNVIGNVLGSSDTAIASTIPTWVGYMSGIMEEGLGRADTSHSGARDSQNAAGVGRIQNTFDVINWCQANGRSYFGLSPADDSDTGMQTYSFCILLTVVDSSGLATVGAHGTVEGDGSYFGHDVWNSVFDSVLTLGAPSSAATGSMSAGYFRQFANGEVRLNPTTGTLTIAGVSMAAITGLITAYNSIYWGARIDGQFYATNYAAPDNLDAPWSGPVAGDGWDLFETHAGKKVTCVHWGGSGSTLSTFDTTANTNVRNRNAFSNYSMGASTAQILDLAAGTNGSGVNGLVDAWATAVEGQGFPILLRPWWEMNSSWGTPFKWQTGAGVSAADYVLAWRALHNRIVAITNCCSFFWCFQTTSQGASGPDPTPWFPGTAYVDWVGWDVYGHSGTTTQDVHTCLDADYAICASLAPGKPIGLGELGVSDGITTPTKAAWITTFLSELPARYPNIKMFSWFNETSAVTDPFIEIASYTSTSAATFAAGIASSYYKANIVNSSSFPSNAKVPIP